MKLTVKRDALLEALTQVQSVVSTRSTIPVLANVLLRADAGKLMLVTTDLEVSVSTEIPAEVATPGETTLPAKRLFSVIRELPPHEIELEVDAKSTASIRCGTAFFKIMGLSADDFPEVPQPEGEQVYTLEQAKLKHMIRCVQYATSVDETRYVLNGILFSFKEQRLTLVATDGRRLALYEEELEFPADHELDMVLPAKTVNELLRNLDSEGQVRLTAAGSQVVIEIEGMRIVSKLIDGNFPNYRQVIPGACEERIAFDRESLLTAVKRVSLVTNEQSNSIKLSFRENAVEIISSTPDIGEAREQVPVKYTGKEMSIAYNPEFLMAPLRVLASDEVYLELIDELSPGVLKSDTAFLYVIMPMRMQ
ncbi:MAG: DNA polymerase III subunit beta [Verrucomicrobia bacterium]|nr:DNA polymerase III subunit beta [Verrucomicrobiota bacterium]MCH8511337.1 DNA polymerase III subunit beta [Kiritimatiellia bacterium]